MFSLQCLVDSIDSTPSCFQKISVQSCVHRAELQQYDVASVTINGCHDVFYRFGIASSIPNYSHLRGPSI